MAWAAVPSKNGDKWERIEFYRCDGYCLNEGADNHQQRAEWNCARADLVPVRWLSRPRLSVWMGRPSTPSEPTPHESHDDGCPGSWYRSPFAVSLRIYERPTTDTGISANPMLDRDADPLLLAWLRELEHERASARANFLELAYG